MISYKCAYSTCPNEPRGHDYRFCRVHGDLEPPKNNHCDCPTIENIVDVSTHAFQCTVCGVKGYYTGKGRAAETLGKDVFDVTDEDIKRTRP